MDFIITLLLLVIVGLLAKILFDKQQEQQQKYAGNANSSSSSRKSLQSNFRRIYDKFNSIDAVQQGLKEAGLEACQLIVGVDFTSSNISQGARTFGGKSLHAINSDIMNPYQQAISVIGRTLERFDEDRQLPAFGFGDITTKDFDVFPFAPDQLTQRYCIGVQEVLSEYARIASCVQLSGPTNFAPIINKAVDIVMQSGRGEYHILLIIADGQVVNEKETVEAIVRASNFPLSIVMIGVGDGPWDQMEEYDDELPQRKFDNFQFVNFHKVMQEAKRLGRDLDTYFAIHALQEIPDQYQACKKLGLIGTTQQTKSSY